MARIFKGQIYVARNVSASEEGEQVINQNVGCNFWLFVKRIHIELAILVTRQIHL